MPRSRTGRPPSLVAGRTVPERLLTAATKLFAQRGFEGTSVQDVVEAAGVTKGAMYHYFASKEDLLAEIYGRLLRMQTERLEKFAAAEGPVVERLHGAAADVVVTTIEHLEPAVIFFRSLHQLSQAKQRQVRRERRRYHDRFCEMISEGQGSGVFRSDVTPDLVADYFFGSVHHLSTWYRPRGALCAAEVGATFADLLLAGLRPA
ncbi:MAG: TetR/AcrR family transcriptional regulator [Thermocrispum sp.]